MLIKFTDNDPRAGTTVRMDSSRGQHFVDTGAAVQVKEDGTKAVTATETSALTTGAEAGDTPKASEGLKVDELKAALTEKGIAIPDGAKKQELADLLDAAE